MAQPECECKLPARLNESKAGLPFYNCGAKRTKKADGTWVSACTFWKIARSELADPAPQCRCPNPAPAQTFRAKAGYSFYGCGQRTKNGEGEWSGGCGFFKKVVDPGEQEARGKFYDILVQKPMQTTAPRLKDVFAGRCSASDVWFDRNKTGTGGLRAHCRVNLLALATKADVQAWLTDCAFPGAFVYETAAKDRGDAQAPEGAMRELRPALA